jgi:hypothetical protein
LRKKIGNKTGTVYVQAFWNRASTVNSVVELVAGCNVGGVAGPLRMAKPQIALAQSANARLTPQTAAT